MNPAKEENAIVLDFLPNGYPFDNKPSFRKSAIAQAIGKDHFVLLELIPKKETSMKNELKNFLKKQLNNSSNTGTDITALDSMSNLNSFSLYKNE